MNREKQLAKNTLIVSFGKICTQFISFFLLPLYTAMLSTEEYGTVDLLNTYVSLLLPVIILQIDQAVFRFLIDYREDEKEKKKLICTTTITVFIQSIVFLIIFSIISIFIKNEYKYFLSLNVVASIFSHTLLQISRGTGDNLTYSLGCLVSGGGSVILNVLFIVGFKWGAYGMLSATFIANCLCALFVFFRKKIYKYIQIKNYSKERLKSLWKYSIPLVPNQLSWWIITVSDRTIVSYILGVGVNGVYSAATKFSSICTTLFNIFNLTWAESASMYINDNDCSEYFSGILDVTLKLFGSLCLGIISFMPFVFKILITGDGYSEAYYQIPILLTATFFNIFVAFLGSLYVALKKSNEIAKTSIYSAVINISVNLILIKFIGLYAASISTLVAYLSMSIYRYIDVQKYVKLKINKKFMIGFIVLSSIIFVLYYIRNRYICFIGALMVSIFAIYNNKKIAFSIINSVKSKVLKKTICVNNR